MGLGNQSKTLSDTQVKIMTDYLKTTRHPDRNILVFLFSIKCGLRAKEISNLTWKMVLDSNNEVGNELNLTNIASKGKSGGRSIPLNKQLKEHLVTYYKSIRDKLWTTKLSETYIITSERSNHVSPQVIVNDFQKWYKKVGYSGCSSHSGRRTFITNVSRKISLVGGSMKDVMSLAGHKNLQTTQLYIDHNQNAIIKVIDLI
jgi:integrase/recombinase XerD